MSKISVQEIERDPEAFVRRVEEGATFLVVRGDSALAEVRPITADLDKPRPFGLCAGEFTVPGDFDEPLPENVIQEFEGS